MQKITVDRPIATAKVPLSGGVLTNFPVKVYDAAGQFIKEYTVSVKKDQEDNNLGVIYVDGHKAVKYGTADGRVKYEAYSYGSPKHNGTDKGTANVEIYAVNKNSMIEMVRVKEAGGADNEWRTRDLRLRRPLLYPAELQARLVRNGAGNGIRTRDLRLGRPSL